ncbi:MAG: M56 family metallopeptidase, partial [Oscillospiraceae bacterium]|nr:M56 family metallopeptidase [Oscillospiraceae bacterium]
MNGLLTLVAASAAGGVLFVLLFALRPLTSRLFSKTWHYYMLYVPVFFLLGGGLLAGRLGGFAASFFPQLPPIATAEAMTVAGLATGGDAVSALPSIPAIAVWEALPTLPEPLTQNAPALLMSVAPAFVALWAMGAVVFLAVNIRNYRAYRRLLLNGSRLISQKSNVGIIASPTASMPMLIGVLQPKIILPDGGFTEAELNMMLLHELAHHRRRDMWLKLIMLVCNAVHWFNPIAYLLSRHVNNLCEMSCDEKVVKAFDFEQRKLYGETILSVLEHRLARKNVVCIIGLCSSKKAIKRRLNNMMNVKKVKKSIIALSLAVSALVVGVGAAVAYSLVSAMPDTDEAPPEAHSASDYEKAAEAPPDEPEAYQIDEIACQ